MNNVEQRVLDVETEMYELDQKYHENLRALREKLRRVRDSCPHEDREYYPDASGNNDSCYVCKACGKEMKR